MNSIDRHLSAESKASTLLAMRSAKRDEILFVVEGDTDIDLFANALGLARSNMLSCQGKERLMSVYQLAPQKGLDEGTIFFRDRDHDDVCTKEINGVLLLVTSRYDLEMEVLENRLFKAIFLDFSACSATDEACTSAFHAICRAAGAIGAVRLCSERNGYELVFEDLKYSRFIKAKTLATDIGAMVVYMFSKSKKRAIDISAIKRDIEKILEENTAVDLCCSKEFYDVMHLALDRTYDYAPSSECSTAVLSRMVRVAANVDDVRALSYYPVLKAKVDASTFRWTGMAL